MMSVEHNKRIVSGNVILLCVSFIFLSNITYAKDLGVMGSVYSIVEPDMLTGIHEKLLSMQKNGELARQIE